MSDTSKPQTAGEKLREFRWNGEAHNAEAHGNLPLSQTGFVDGCARCYVLQDEKIELIVIEKSAFQEAQELIHALEMDVEFFKKKSDVNHNRCASFEAKLESAMKMIGDMETSLKYYDNPMSDIIIASMTLNKLAQWRKGNGI